MAKKNNNTKIVLFIIIIITLFLAGFYAKQFFIDEEAPEPTGETEYTFSEHNFILIDNLWYSLMKSINGKLLIEVALHFGPKELLDYPVYGNLSSFIPIENGYVSFDPLEPELGYIMLANGEFSLTLAKAYSTIQDNPFNLTTVCSRDDFKSCSIYPIINCTNTNNTVIFLKQVNETGIFVEDNCIIVQGKNEDLVKGVDRLMYSWFGVLP